MTPQKQPRSKAVEMRIANTADYALRKVKDASEYRAVSGEYTKRAAGATKPDEQTRRDLKFRAFGAPIQSAPGPKELHMSFTGQVQYFQTNEMLDLIDPDFTKWSTKPAGMDEADWIRIRRYAQPLIVLEVELWLANEGAPAPLRSSVPTRLDGDWSSQEPMSRVDIVQYAQEFSSSQFTGQTGNATATDDVLFALGGRKFTIESELVLPVVQLESFANYIVPVATLHIGGRSMGAHNISASFTLEGKAYYLA